MHTVGLTLQTLGAVMIGLTAIKVHSVVSKEMKLDKHAYKAMKKERLLGIVGIIFLLLGYILQIT